MSSPSSSPFRIRRTKSAVSAVVGTILMVAITIVLAAVLYVTISGIMVQTPVKNPEFILDPGPWQNGTVALSFLSLTNAEGLAPDQLSYIIQAQNGTIYYAGLAGGNKTLVANITVNVTYQDTGNVGEVSTEDLIVIRVTPVNATAIRDCTFKVIVAERVAAQVNSLG